MRCRPQVKEYNYHSLENKIVALSKDQKMLCFKSDNNFENRDPLKLKMLHNTLIDCYAKNSVLQKNGNFFVPIVNGWMKKNSRLIGTLMILEPSKVEGEQSSMGRKKQIKMSISSRAIQSINSFTECLICGLKSKASDIEYKRLINLSRMLSLLRQYDVSGN